MTKVRVFEEDSNGHKVKLVGVFDNDEAEAQDVYSLVTYVD